MRIHEKPFDNNIPDYDNSKFNSKTRLNWGKVVKLRANYASGYLIQVCVHIKPLNKFKIQFIVANQFNLFSYVMQLLDISCPTKMDMHSDFPK